MVKWLALWMAWMALVFTPSSSEVSAIRARVDTLEHRECTLMVVSTPVGEATICALK